MQFLRDIFRRVAGDIKRCWVALIILIVYLALTQSFFGTVCPFAIMTGLPCPACGLTRAFFAVMTGQLSVAWQYNATIFLWILLIFGWIFSRYVLGRKQAFLLPAAAMVSAATIMYFGWRWVYGTLPDIPSEGMIQTILRILFTNSLSYGI